MKSIILILILSTFCMQLCFGQKKYLLLDKSTYEPVCYATIYDPLDQTGSHSDEEGFFTMKFQNKIRISHILYESQLVDLLHIQDTVFLTSKNRVLNAIEIVAEKERKKIKKKNIIKAGIGKGKTQMQYEGIKEAALLVENPAKRACYLHKLSFSFSKVKFKDGGKGTIKDKDLLLSIQVYERSAQGEPGRTLIKTQITRRLKAKASQLKVDLAATETIFPAEGGFIAVEFLGYYEGEQFIPLDFDDLHIRKQFAPGLSGGHQKKASFYRKTFSEQWKRVNVKIKGFYNFNFGLELVLSED